MANERLKRGKPGNKRCSLHDANDYSYNDTAGAFKTLGPIMGKLKALGAGDAGIAVGAGKLIAIFNDGGNTEWADMGVTNPALPGAGTIALTSKSYTILAMGDDTWVKASAAHCYVYEIIDDTVYTP